MDRLMLYDIIYALAARDGRQAVLFGDCAELARNAFSRSLAGDYFPELWFEMPLAGEPWFDLHALVSHGDLDARATFTPETCGGCPEAFSWFSTQGPGARQLALSWDVGAGDATSPAVQLLVGDNNLEVTSGFLEAAGRADAVSAYRAFTERLPRGWFACYAGVFPRRTFPFLRVECIPRRELQRSYVEDRALLEAHLRQAGLAEPGDSVLERCQALADTPFALEFQFDVTPDGSAGSTLGASVRFAAPSDENSRAIFDVQGEAGELMRRVEAWGLADDRWKLFAGATYAQRVSFKSESCLLYCYPAFLKLRWRDGIPLDAKAYLIAGTQ